MGGVIFEQLALMELTDLQQDPEAIFLDWELWMTAQGLSIRTITERTRTVRAASLSIGQPPTALSSRDLRAWLAAMPSPGTKDTYYSALKAWFTWLIREGRRLDDPMVLVPRPLVPRRTPRPVSTHDLQLALASDIWPETRAKFFLAMYLGKRVSEIAVTHGREFDLSTGKARFIRKGNIEVELPIHECLVPIIESFPRRGYWFPSPANPARPVLGNSVSTVISEAFARVGSNATAHQIRHWYATELLLSGTDIRVVQELMSHASLATTAIYTQVNDAQRRQAISGLPKLQFYSDR